MTKTVRNIRKMNSLNLSTHSDMINQTIKNQGGYMKRLLALGMAVLLTGCSGSASSAQVQSTSTGSEGTAAVTAAERDFDRELKIEYDKGYRKGFVEGKNSVIASATTPAATAPEPAAPTAAEPAAPPAAEPAASPAAEPSTTPSATAGNGVYQFTAGETLPITSDKGNYELIVEGVRVTKKRNQYSEIKPVKVIFLDFNYKNIDREDGVYVFSSDFNVIDAEGNICDTYPVSDDSRNAKEVPPGVKSKGTEAYAITTDSPYVIVQVLGGSWSSKVIAQTQIQLNK